MSYFDLRHALLLVLNILKSQTAAMPWEWDPFTIATHLTCLKFWILLLFLCVFSFISIGIPLPPPTTNTGYIHVRIKNMSPLFLVSFLGFLFLPQTLFWYLYPIIIVFFLYYSCISNVFSRFVFWAQAVTYESPNVSIFITTNNADNNNDREMRNGHGEADIEEGGRTRALAQAAS